MDLGLGGKRAAVAAASRGLGFGTAAALAAEGVQVAICGRDPERIGEAADRIGHGCVPVVADVGTVAGATEFVQAASAALGGVDILVPNAGGPPAGNFASIDDLSAYSEAFELNCLSTIAMCKAAVPEMQARHWGRVVAITSVAVRQPMPYLILSNTARAGLTAFLKTLAREVAGDGITVNSLQPGFHDTERIRSLHDDPSSLGASVPAGFIGTAADFGAVAAFVCSEPARYLTGVAIPVDGGTFGGAAVMGLRHVVTFVFLEGTTDEQIVAVTAALETLPGLIPQIRDYRVGRDAGINEGNHQYAVVADFESVDDYLVYRDHPAHLAIIAEHIRPILGSRAAVQFHI